MSKNIQLKDYKKRFCKKCLSEGFDSLLPPFIKQFNRDKVGFENMESHIISKLSDELNNQLKT